MLPREEGAKPVDVRELHGFTPWYFGIPPHGKGYEVAWKQLMDTQGFQAPYGPTTAERRHPGFTIFYDKTGERYNKGKGLRILSDGKEIGFRENLGILRTKLSAPQ